MPSSRKIYPRRWPRSIFVSQTLIKAWRILLRHAFYVLIMLAWAPSLRANPVVRPHTTVELISESTSIRPGQALTLAIHMTPQDKWHTYYKNFGDSGIETSALWTLPKQFSVSSLEYPTPSRIMIADLVNFGYEAPSTLLVQLKAPTTINATTLPISVQLNWLVCSDQICVPEDAILQLSLTRGDGLSNPATAKIFGDARAALPKKMAWPARYLVSEKNFRLEADIGQGLPDIQSAYFYPDTLSIIANAAPQKIIYNKATLRLETGAALQGAAPKFLSGVLAIKTKGNDVVEGFAIVAQSTPTLSAAAPSLSPLVAIGFALLGGLLLNLMPCVFPILSLKALALAKAGGSPAQAKREALWYSIGVVASFLILAVVLLSLRAAGQSIGWGFQLQDPRVVGVLALLMVLVALNLFGVFEVSTRFAGAGQGLAESGGRSGAFWTGTLAVLVATPCTAPFMASALGAAIALPPVLGLMVFAGLGVGMALPFLLLGYVPALRRWLPKPGAWMVKFKILLGFPMLATALWLMWVAYQQAGANAVYKLLAAALLLSLGAWIHGRRKTKMTLLAAVAGIAAIALVLTLHTTALNGSKTHALAGAPYSDAALATALSSGKPVFVYFTADWCISCKVNERSTLADTKVQKTLAAANAVILVADWTNRDDAIARTLARHGRSGVPLYLWYRAGSPTPEILPQLLTPSIMIDIVAAK
jgi:thiol:disulfide interchange protein